MFFSRHQRFTVTFASAGLEFKDNDVSGAMLLLDLRGCCSVHMSLVINVILCLCNLGSMLLRDFDSV